MLTRRVKKIVTRAQDKVVREYRISYQQSPVSKHSQITSIQEVAGDQERYAFPPSQFQWRGGHRDPLKFKSSKLSRVLAAGGKVYVHGDFDGDGRTDFLSGPAKSPGLMSASVTELSAHLSTKGHEPEPAALKLPPCDMTYNGGAIARKVMASGYGLWSRL